MKFNYKVICLLISIVVSSSIECAASDLVFGPYEVGFDTYKKYDNSRLYLLGEDTIFRPLLIHFWYPSKEKKEGHTLNLKHYIDLIAQRENFGKAESDIDNESFYYVKGYSDFAKNNFGLDSSLSAKMLLESPVYAKSDISLKNDDTAFPLLIYAPSNSKSSVQNHLLCEYLASHGFMILSVASAGPNSIKREKFEESTMAQVTDMEWILKFCKDSMNIKYSNLGVFGFSSGGNAISLFQMRNENVEAVLSLDGGQEYLTYLKLYNMPDFDLKKANVPYCSIINNYENYSIYPYYNSIVSTTKFLFRMPHLDHNGFVSYWKYFDSCSKNTSKNNSSISFAYLSECAVEFFNEYLKSSSSTLFDNKNMDELTNEFIMPSSKDFSNISLICNRLLDNDYDSALSLMEQHKEELFRGASQVNILAKMLSDTDKAVWLYKKGTEYCPESWETYYKLGQYYKENGEILLARKALLDAKELNPENTKITDLLTDIEKIK